MPENKHSETVKVRAKSPGKYPILVVELPTDELVTTYYETDYSIEHTKPVSEDWLKENALGRHSFIEVEPPEEVAAGTLEDYVRREVLGET